MHTKTSIIPHSLLTNWNLAGSRASYITFVYVYTCTLTGKPVQYEHVHVVQTVLRDKHLITFTCDCALVLLFYYG